MLGIIKSMATLRELQIQYVQEIMKERGVSATALASILNKSSSTFTRFIGGDKGAQKHLSSLTLEALHEFSGKPPPSMVSGSSKKEMKDETMAEVISNLISYIKESDLTEKERYIFIAKGIKFYCNKYNDDSYHGTNKYDLLLIKEATKNNK
jgi:hypothetical protein